MTLRVLFLCIMVFITSQFLAAQTAELRGQIADQSGALVAGAQVPLTGPDGVKTNTTADLQGRYSFTDIAVGKYTITGSSPQLTTAKATTIVLHSGLQTINLKLVVEEVKQEVSVKDDSSQVTVDAGSNANGLVLRGDDLAALADNPDDFQADLQALAGPSAGPNGGAFYIDGFSGGDIPPKESIREIRINQNPFSPEYDKVGYGRIDILTKPGTDRYRSTIDYNLGSKIWNSRNPYSPVKAPFLLNEFEGTGGGPLNKRSSYTLDVQRNMVDNGSITSAVVLDSGPFAIIPFSSTMTTHQRLTRATPRIDYQLN